MSVIFDLSGGAAYTVPGGFNFVGWVVSAEGPTVIRVNGVQVGGGQITLRFVCAQPGWTIQATGSDLRGAHLNGDLYANTASVTPVAYSFGSPYVVPANTKLVARVSVDGVGAFVTLSDGTHTSHVCETNDTVTGIEADAGWTFTMVNGGTGYLNGLLFAR